MMAYYRNLGLDTAQGFNDYMERTIGRSTPSFPLSFCYRHCQQSNREHHNQLSPISGNLAPSLEKKAFNDANKTSYLTMVKFVANLVWNGEFVLESHKSSKLHSADYQQKDQHRDPEKNKDCLESVLLCLCPVYDVGQTEASDATYGTAVDLACFSALIYLVAPSEAYLHHLMQSLPCDTDDAQYGSQLGDCHHLFHVL